MYGDYSELWWKVSRWIGCMVIQFLFGVEESSVPVSNKWAKLVFKSYFLDNCVQRHSKVKWIYWEKSIYLEHTKLLSEYSISQCGLFVEKIDFFVLTVLIFSSILFSLLHSFNFFFLKTVKSKINFEFGFNLICSHILYGLELLLLFS